MEKDKAVLLEVDDTTGILTLLDGRRLQVNPGDIPSVCVWLPMTELEISETEEGEFFVSVQNMGNDQVITAIWI